MAKPGPRRRKVWITRTEPGAGRTAVRLAALGFEPLIAPLLTIELMPNAVALEAFEALALTSGQAVFALGPGVPRTTRVFAVGETTARAARAAGFIHVTSADGDVQALADLILKERPLAVVYPTAEKMAGDLVGQLAEADLPARRVVVYRAASANTLPAEAARAFADEAVAAILVHSPRAGQVAGALLAKAGVDPAAAPAFGLSPACVRPLAQQGFTVHAAAQPKEAAVMALLARTLGETI